MFESYTTALIRERRFVVSGSIVIAAAIGAASVAASVPTAYFVAKSETAHITEEQNALRAIDVDNGIHNNFINHNISLAIAKDLDNIRYTSALSAHNSYELHHAIQMKDRVTHMFSKDTVLSFSDPGSERWFTTIKEIVSNNTQGLTSSEIKEATRISADLSTLTTTVVPIQFC